MAADKENDYIPSITPDVMKCLDRTEFFRKLDDSLCPAADAPPKECSHTYATSEAILRESGFDKDDIEDIVAVLQSLGGCCDCEILYNVAESSRLKANYWRNRAANVASNHRRGNPNES